MLQNDDYKIQSAHPDTLKCAERLCVGEKGSKILYFLYSSCFCVYIYFVCVCAHANQSTNQSATQSYLHRRQLTIFVRKINGESTTRERMRVRARANSSK